MIEFHNLDPQRPYDVTGEVHVIEDGKIVLDHTPLKGSVVIPGYRETDSWDSALFTSFYIDYQEETGYRTATQVVRFSPAASGRTVTVSYKGVGTIIRAETLNEMIRAIEDLQSGGSIKAHNESGSAHYDIRQSITATEEAFRRLLNDHKTDELAHSLAIARGIGIHDEDKAAHADIREAVEAVSTKVDEFVLASDDEIAEMLDMYFESGVPVTRVVQEMMAEDDYADDMLDEFFPGDVDPVGTPDISEEVVADDDEFESMLDEIWPANN